MLDFIMTHLTMEERLCQLAEEAAALGQAALKLRRVCDGKNPTPVTFDEAFKGLKEEIADVMVCLTSLGLMAEPKAYQKEMDSKMETWAARLKEKAGDG